MPRILVCGCSGSGKSTFARAIVAHLGVPYISIDAHYWKPGWQQSSDEELRERLAPHYAGHNWLSDGNYFGSLGEMHLSRATHVYFFDLPRWKALTGALWRIATNHGKVRSEMAPGCPERLNWDFIRDIWTYNTRQRPKMMAHFNNIRPEQRLVVFLTREDADAEIERIAHVGLA